MAGNLKEHPYIEIRENGTNFCVLCLEPCHSDTALFRHLNCNFHEERLSCATLTMLRPNPWPFSDGIVFYTSTENSNSESTTGNERTLVIPRVGIADETVDVKVREIGTGKIAARYGALDGNEIIKRMWCEWLGKENSNEQDGVGIQEHDYAVLIFSQRNDLGQMHQQRETKCEICYQEMIFGKDVAVIMKLKNGAIACCCQNQFGVFHVFHTSCVIHWILVSEYEIMTNGLAHSNLSQEGDKKIKHVFCPECQGSTGFFPEDGPLERNFTCSLSQIFRMKLKAFEARKEWIKSPEILENCSIGFHFPQQSEEIVEEKVKPIKLLRFYRAEDNSVGNRNYV